MPDPDLRELTDADRIVTQFVMESKMDTSADQLTFDPQPTTNPSEKSSLQTHRRSRKRLQKEVDELRSRLAQAEQEKESLRARLARAVSSVAIPQPLPVTPSDSAPLSLPAAIEKMTSTVRLLNKTLTLSGRKKLPNGLPASPRAPSWCSRCIVKGGWWVSVHYGKDQEHNCVFDGHATRCRYCTTYGKDKCIPIPRRLWPKARRLIESIQKARGNEDALRATGVAAKKFERLLRKVRKADQQVEDRKMRRVESTLDQLISMQRRQLQFLLHDHDLDMAIAYEDVSEDE